MSNNKTILVITVEIEEGLTGEIHVKNDSNFQILAKEFLKKFSLP
jgi:hypothetical protein